MVVEFGIGILKMHVLSAGPDGFLSEPVEVPDFTIIVGKNGVGKTRLLNKIKSGSVRHSAVFVDPENPPDFMSQHEIFESMILRPFSPDHSGNTHDGGHGVTDADGKLVFPILSISQDGQRMNISSAFERYRAFYNDTALSAHHDGKNLTKEEIFDQHGEPPWVQINRFMERQGLNIRFKKQSLDLKSRIDTNIYKVDNDEPFPFSGLSPGERITMSIALMVFGFGNGQGSRQGLGRRVLLLDESDSHLHPSSIKKMMEMITDELIPQHNLCVVMTTHSPTTAALAPEGSIYRLEGTSKALEPVTKAEAVAELTVGVPSLSIAFGGRRQVFVESATDQKIYSVAYEALRSNLFAGRSLTFIPSGRKSTSGQEDNAGCERVKKLVKELRRNGANTVFGIIDWDGRNIPDDGIHVFAEGSRNGIENFFLDPVMIVCDLALRYPKFLRDVVILPQELRSTDMRDYSQEGWQSASNRMLDFVFGEQSSDVASLVSTRVNGMSIKIPEHILKMHDHDFEAKLAEKISVYASSKANGDFCFKVADSVCQHFPEILPDELTTMFNSILSHETR